MCALKPKFWLQTSSLIGLGEVIISPCLCDLHCMSHHRKPCFLEASYQKQWSEVNATVGPKSAFLLKKHQLQRATTIHVFTFCELLSRCPLFPSFPCPWLCHLKEHISGYEQSLYFCFLNVLWKPRSICRPRGRICCFHWYHDTLNCRKYLGSALTFVFHAWDPKFWRSLSNYTTSDRFLGQHWNGICTL